MPNGHPHSEKEIQEPEVKQMFRMMFQKMHELQKEVFALREQVTINNAKVMTAGEWLSPREFSQLTGENYKTVIYKCNQGQYRTKPRDRAGTKVQIHRSELERHKFPLS